MPDPIEYKPRVEIIGRSQDNRKQQKPKREGPDRELRRITLAEVTLSNIGRPDDLVKVDVQELWDLNHYRVDIHRSFYNIDKDSHSVRITDSYFVEIFDDGVVASPPMTRKYYDDLLESGDLEGLYS